MEKLYGYWIHLIKIPLKKKPARMYSTAYVNFVLCRQVYWIKVYMHVEYSQAISNLYS